MICDAAHALLTGQEQHSRLKLHVYLQIDSCLLPLATANFQALPFAQIRHGRGWEDPLIYCGLAGGWAAQIFSHGLEGGFTVFKRGIFFKKKKKRLKKGIWSQFLISSKKTQKSGMWTTEAHVISALQLPWDELLKEMLSMASPWETGRMRCHQQPVKQPGKTGQQKGQLPKMLGNDEWNQLGMERTERTILPTPCACSVHVGCPALKSDAIATDLLVLFCATAEFTAFWKKKTTLPGGKVFVERYSRSIVHKRESFQNVRHKTNVPWGLF